MATIRKHIQVGTSACNCTSHGPYVAKVWRLDPPVANPSGFLQRWLNDYTDNCPTCNAAWQDEADQHDADIKGGTSEKQRRALARFTEAGVPKRYSECTVWNWKWTNDRQRKVWEWAKDYVNNMEHVLETGRCGIFMGAPGAGKALALDTPLPTPTGWTTMGEVQVGDEVFDESGKPCRVTFATEVQKGRTCYEVLFSDGSTIVADAEHRWVVTRSHHRDSRLLMNTEQIAGNLTLGLAIENCGSMQLPDADLPVDPYVLGVWLGDGDSARAWITKDDPVQVALVAATGISMEERPSHGRARKWILGRAKRGSGLSMQTQLRALGVIGDKHIPQVYLRASTEQRMRLLNGILDTDGYVDPASGSVEFCTVYQKFADTFVELLSSLGIKARHRQSDAKLYGRVVSQRWRVHFIPTVPVFSLPRKAAVQVGQGRTTGRRYIKAVTKVPSVDVRCIQVDSTSHLYLASKAMIPTHNTHLAIGIVRHVVEKGGTALYTTVADMLGRIKNTYHRDAEETEQKVIDHLASVDLLVADEVGRETSTEHNQSQFFRVLDLRYRNLKPTILVSNLSRDKLGTFLGSSIVDRMTEAGGGVLVFDWVSNRSTKLPSKESDK